MSQGTPTDVWIDSPATAPMGWRWAFLLLGPIGILILLIVSAGRDSTVIELPIGRETLRLVLRQRRVALAILGVGVALVLIGFTGGTWAVRGAVIGAVLVLIGLMVFGTARSRHWITTELRGDAIVVSGVHPTVATLIDQLPPTSVRTAGLLP